MTDPFSSAPPRRGVRGFLDTLAQLLFTRAELFSLEAQEHKEQLVHTMLLGGVALVCFLLAGVAVLLTLFAVLPPEWRGWLLAAVAVCLLLSSLWLLQRLSAHLRHTPPPFHDSLRELRRDWDVLSGKQK